MASEGQSESRVSSRTQASSWERCMVPVGWGGTHRRQRGQMRKQALSGLAGLRADAGPRAALRRLGAL